MSAHPLLRHRATRAVGAYVLLVTAGITLFSSAVGGTGLIVLCLGWALVMLVPAAVLLTGTAVPKTAVHETPVLQRCRQDPRPGEKGHPTD